MSFEASHFVARHIVDIPRSGIRDFFEIVQSMENVVSLGIGEPDFVTPWHIREVAIYSLEQGKTGYTSNLGAPKLRQEIARYMESFIHVPYNSKNEILVTVGVSEALDIALRAVLNPGDEVLYHTPCYVSYHPSVTMAHGVPVPVATFEKDGFSLKAEAIEEKITPKSKVLMLNFPTNPTGAVLPREEQFKIAELCKKHNLLVITDEIYGELTYQQQHQSIASIEGMKERCIVLHGVSKAFAMTGFRIGFACAPSSLIEAMMKVHQYAMLCAPITSQEAALEALRAGGDAMRMMREQYLLRRNFMLHHFEKLNIPCLTPKGSFYLFPNISHTGLTSKDFSLRLLHEQKVAVVPGSAFGESGEVQTHGRFSILIFQLV
jgi:aminotransferase